MIPFQSLFVKRSDYGPVIKQFNIEQFSFKDYFLFRVFQMKSVQKSFSCIFQNCFFLAVRTSLYIYNYIFKYVWRLKNIKLLNNTIITDAIKFLRQYNLNLLKFQMWFSLSLKLFVLALLYRENTNRIYF
jgi:hypothetical protein